MFKYKADGEFLEIDSIDMFRMFVWEGRLLQTKEEKLLLLILCINGLYISLSEQMRPKA